MASIRIKYYFALLPLCCFGNASAHPPIPSTSHSIAFPKEDFDNADGRIRDADILFDAGMVQQAIDAYQHILADLNDPLSSTATQTALQARFHLALAYASLGDWAHTIETAERNVSGQAGNGSAEEIRRNSLFLLAMAFKESKQVAKASEAFAQYIQMPEPPLLPLKSEALFEIALAHYQNGKYLEADQAFRAVSAETERPRLAILASLYLAKIDLAEGRYQKAQTALSKLARQTKPDDALSYEIAYQQGEAAYRLKDYSQAVAFYQRSLPADDPEGCDWYPKAMYQVGVCFLDQADRLMNREEEQAECLDRAEEAISKMLAVTPSETGYLALAQCHLSRVKLLKQTSSYGKAEAILSQQDHFHSSEAKAHALFLRAEAAPTYEKRDTLFRQLTQKENSGNPYYAKGWYLRGLNDFECGLFLESRGDIEGSKAAFAKSADILKTAYALLQTSDNILATSAAKHQALAISYAKGPRCDLEAYQVIDLLINQTSSTHHAPDNMDELHYLHGYFAGILARSDSKYLPIAVNSLQAAAFEGSRCTNLALSYLGALYFDMKNYGQSEAVYLQLAEKSPSPMQAAEGWYWSARCADMLGRGQDVGNERRHHVYENYPDSPFAPEAYFTIYTYQEYLQGDRNAIKHLQSFEDKFKTSPFLMEAGYLIGLDYTRDRKSPEGKWIRKKSLTDAIDAFQQVETLFEALKEEGSIPKNKLAYYTAMKHRATLNRAMANLAIAEEARGAKQQIYLEYAEDVFQNLLTEKDAQPSILEECTFGLAKTYIMGGDDKKADAILSQIINNGSRSNQQRGYFLARSWDEKGRIAMRSKNYKAALEHFDRAEEASKGGCYSTDQQLDMWIQQSFCCTGLEQYDDAILILSKVANHDAVSSLRMKAMYLRAETYELQGRPELARKQLESMAKKGGVWARKAKEKLEKDYGH